MHWPKWLICGGGAAPATDDFDKAVDGYLRSPKGPPIAQNPMRKTGNNDRGGGYDDEEEEDYEHEEEEQSGEEGEGDEDGQGEGEEDYEAEESVAPYDEAGVDEDFGEHGEWRYQNGSPTPQRSTRSTAPASRRGNGRDASSRFVAASTNRAGAPSVASRVPGSSYRAAPRGAAAVATASSTTGGRKGGDAPSAARPRPPKQAPLPSSMFIARL